MILCTVLRQKQIIIESKDITLITPTFLNIFTQVYEYPRESQSQIV